MMIWAAFLVCFVVGPLLFRAATQHDPSQAQLRGIAWMTIALSVAAMAVRNGLVPQWGSNLVLSISGVFLIWLAWIGILAFGTQTLRRVDSSLCMKRWSGVAGAMCTTVPWFGLASADWVGPQI